MTQGREISIIVPVYNVACCLVRCLDSLLRQTCGRIEIVPVDDASTDSSRQILVDYASKYDFIKPVLLDRNEGLSQARVHGFEACSGSFIGAVDADDWLRDDAIEKLRDIAEGESADVVRFSGEMHGESGEPLPGESSVYAFRDESFQSGQDYLKSAWYPSMVLHFGRRYLWEQALPWFKRLGDHVLGEDNFQSFALCFPARKIVSISTPLYCRSVREGSITKSLSVENGRAHIAGRHHVLELLRIFLEEKHAWEEYEETWKRIERHNAYYILHNFILPLGKEAREQIVPLWLERFEPAAELLQQARDMA